MFLFIITFLLGLFIGSFLLVVINRFCSGKSFVHGRSECEFCHHTLSIFDLIPLISFIFLRRKCRYCHKKLSVRYPLSELGTGLFFSLSFIPLSQHLSISSPYFLIELLFILFFLSTCIVTFFIDLKCGIIPFFMVIPCILLLLVKNVFLPETAAPYFLLSGGGAFLFLFMFFLITLGRGMGFGDCIFALLMGLLLGFPEIITAFYIAFLTGAFVSLILILWKRKKLKNSTIPFGPFLVLGTYVTFLYGDPITHFFFSLITH